MMKRKQLSGIAAVLAAVMLLMTLLSGCGAGASAPEQAGSAANGEGAAQGGTPAAAAPAAQSGAEAGAARQDGERFEAVIILEGMEETVRYEHIRNDAVGFEMDYDYENFVRCGDADSERFVSDWDDPENPENYLEVMYNPQDAEAFAADVIEVLSHEYETSRSVYMLERAGGCIRIDASADVGGETMPEQLQMVYIIPAADGCRVATAHYAIEASEGFGRRFAYFMHSFTVLDGAGDRRMSDEQALAAIKRYCRCSNPDLADIEKAGEYRVSWEVQSSDEREIVILFTSYTGAQIRYHIDPFSGEAYVTEFVSGVTDEETRTEESLNAWDYSF